MEKKLRYKVFFVSAVILSQAGRFLTFSNGSLVNIVIATLSLLVLLRMYDPKSFRPLFLLCLFMFFVFSVAIISTGIFDVLFYRVFLSDEAIAQESVHSRVEQYKGLLMLIKEKPQGIVFGYGAAELPALIGRKYGKVVDLHNTYLRPLGVAGIAGFFSFSLLCLLCLNNFISAVRGSYSDENLRIIAIIFFAAFIGWSVQAGTLISDTGVIQWFFFILAYSLKRYSSYGVA